MAMFTAESLSSLELHRSATALILASARGDTQGVAHLLFERSPSDLIALVVYCARFAATLATKAHEEPDVNPIELLERFALELAAVPSAPQSS